MLAIRVWRLLRAGLPMYEAEGLETLHARSFTLDSKYPLDVARDGEAMRLDPPVDFTLQESALRVVCPRLHVRITFQRLPGARIFAAHAN